MNAKIILAAVAVSATAVGAAAISSLAPAESIAVRAAEESPATSAAVAPVAAAPPTQDGRSSEARPAWSRRLAAIKSAHARGQTQPRGPQDLRAQALELLTGCKQFLPDVPADLELTAYVVGAPDIGTVVERVELTGSKPPQDLQECLSESMYTLDLGPADTNFEDRITLGVSHHAFECLDDIDVDAIPEQELSPEMRAALEAAKGRPNLFGDGPLNLVTIDRAALEAKFADE